METILDNQRFVKRAFWLVKLRWYAIFLFICIAGVVIQLYDVSSQKLPFFVIGIFLLGYNVLLFIFLRYIFLPKAETGHKTFHRIIILQITADMFILTGILYYSGSIENPFYLFYILYAILSSMLLSRSMSYFQTTLAVFLFGLLITLEYLQVMQHQHVTNFLSDELYRNRNYVLGTFAVFSITMYLAVYMTTSIVVQLRKQQTGYKRLNLELNKKDRVKNEYLLSVSHDIKSHMAAIKSCLDILSTHMVGPLNEKQSELVDRADYRAYKSIVFLSTLLKLTQMRLTGEIEKERFSLKQCVYDAFSAVEEKAEKKAISIGYKINVKQDWVFGSSLLIEETIRNILFNAIKYTPENGTVNLSVTEDDTYFIIEITDTGIGIPPDEKDRIFEEFYRASNARRAERDGTGLGLSISKEVVERHGGTIWVALQQGRGSTFNFTLPKYTKE